jgi:hypothetical protein
MKKIALLFAFTLPSINVFAVEEPSNAIQRDPITNLRILKCEEANFQYPRCIDSNGKVIDNPKFIEYGKNNPDRRGIRKSPHITVE